MVTPRKLKGRVLIIDDEIAVLRLYANSLAAAGFEVAKTSGGKQALQRIEGSEFDVILSDISMPGIDGLTLLRQMRARFPDLPVILMLDIADNQTAIRATELGAIQCLIKPITAEVLEQTAAYAVRLRQSRRSAHRPSGDARIGETRSDCVTATDAKNEFGRVLESVIRGGKVFITKHDARKAVLISIDEFDALSRSTRSKLDSLSGEFDALLARMQMPGTRAKMKAAFDASPKQLGRAAVRIANKRD